MSNSKLSEFDDKVRRILRADLPSSAELVREGRIIAKEIEIGRTAFFDLTGVSSEADYKRQCIREGRIMFHAHLGMNTWETTRAALQFLYRASHEQGIVIDRAGICLDRRMGLPKEVRLSAPAETGPILESNEDWQQVGQAAPIQPHMGDFMIGFPASTDNTICGLRAGVTTIGNLSQYFAHEVPMWRDTVTTTLETVRAMAIMGALRQRGTLMHSYLEDGYGALFNDSATVAGWALMERYIVEELLGAKLSHCIGGLTSDPIKRAGWVFALKVIHGEDFLGSMFYGDTISFSKDFNRNRGLVAEYLLWDIMAQLVCPTGQAVVPLPVTEAVRIPSAEEILDIHLLGRRMEAAARRLLPFMDFSASRDFADKLVTAGRDVFTRALDGLRDAGVDLRDPVQLMYVLKKLGPEVFEGMFGAGEESLSPAIWRKSMIPTDIFETAQACLEDNRLWFLTPRVKSIVAGRCMLLASTDVHQHAIRILDQLLSEAGTKVINLGAEVNPGQVAEEASAQNVDCILISTHNGMALEYSKNLKKELKLKEVKAPVIMGGVLNQKIDTQALPVDVTNDLKLLGFHPYVQARLESHFGRLLEIPQSGDGDTRLALNGHQENPRMKTRSK